MPGMPLAAAASTRRALAASSSASSAARRSFASVPPARPASAAARLIQRRATTGSVSSVFYLKTLGEHGSGCGTRSRSRNHARKQGEFVETVFVGLVGLPIGVLGIGGLCKMAGEGRL